MKNNNPNPNSKNQNSHARKGKKRVLVGHRMVAMQANQVDEIARMEGRGQHPNVVDQRLRCSWCFLKTDGKHSCRWRTKNNIQPLGGPVLQVPLYEWVSEGSE